MAKLTISELRSLVAKYWKIPDDQKTERQKLEQDYLENTMGYYEMKQVAIKMGNKHPDENFIVKSYFEKMNKAHEKLVAFIGGE